MSDEDAKVVGHQTDDSGETYGVWGEVDSEDGYGLYTPDDARIEGLLSTRGSLEVETSSDRALELGTVTRQGSRDSGLEFMANGNVVFGYLNEVDDAIGATISGGGSDDVENDEERPNLVSGDFGTVSGGEGNEVVTDDSTVGGGQDNVAGNAGDDEATHATVGGGESNSASGAQSTVGGGEFNAALNTYSTIGGGRANTAMAESSTIGGGELNIARFSDDTVGGGNDNEAGGGGATVSGGRENEADGLVSTVGGGEDNTAEGNSGTVSGGTTNKAIGGAATVSGGSGNVASGSRSTIPGGLNNEASGSYSFATGRNATATHDGSVVFGDSTSEEITSQTKDEVRFQGELSFGDGTPQRTAGPIAKGHVEADGTLTNGVNVDDVSWSDDNLRYQIIVDGVEDTSTDEYAVTATPTDEVVAARTFATGGDGLAVQFEYGEQQAFTFVVHSLTD